MGDIKMRKVKVLVLITAMDRGGAETMVMNYLRNIDREKVQMDFLVIRKYKSDYEDEIKQMGSISFETGGNTYWDTQLSVIPDIRKR